MPDRDKAGAAALRKNKVTGHLTAQSALVGLGMMPQPMLPDACCVVTEAREVRMEMAQGVNRRRAGL